MGNDAAGTDAADCSADSSACEQSCEAKTTDKFRNVLSGIQASVDRKRAVYEQAKVDACLQTIRSAACGTLNMTGRLEGVPGCGSFVTPLVALGGACGNDYECIAGWCKHDAASQSFDGVCTAFAAVAESCGDEARCASDLRCDPKTKDPADDVCVAVGPVGAACSDASECQSGVCSGSGGSGKTCAEPAGASMLLRQRMRRCRRQSPQRADAPALRRLCWGGSGADAAAVSGAAADPGAAAD